MKKNQMKKMKTMKTMKKTSAYGVVHIVSDFSQPHLDAVSMKNLVKIKMQNVLQMKNVDQKKREKKALAIVVDVKDIILQPAMLRVTLEGII